MLLAVVLLNSLAGPPVTFLEANCLDCHEGARAKGGADIASLLDNAREGGDLLLWDRVRARLDARDMPPRVDKRPPVQAYDAALMQVNAVIDALALDQDHAGAPGSRRLNRMEWGHGVSDLLGIQLDVQELLPPDEIGHGFDTLGNALTLSPPVFERYLEAAERAAMAAVSDPAAPVFAAITLTGRELEVVGAARRQGDAVRMHSRASARARLHVERLGRHHLVLHAHGQQAGDEPVRFAMDVNGERIGVLDVPGTTDAAHVIEVTLPAGEVVIGATFINDFYQPDHPDPRERDRNAVVHAIAVQGPLDAPIRTPLEQLLPEDWAHTPPGRPRRRLLRNALEPLLARAWRQSVDAATLDTLVSMAIEAADSPHDQLRAGLTGMLAHPRFLVRLETPPSPPASERPLDPDELAARLALFLWSSVPDAVLIQAAADGGLDTPEGRQEQVERMLRDPRGRRLAERFAPQWLQTGRLDVASPDPRRFATVDNALLASMQQEVVDTFDHVLRSGRPWSALLTSNETIVDAPLAAHYGLGPVDPEGVHRVTRPAAAGVLQQAAVLLATSNPTRTSPVKRGKWVLETLLDAPPPPPPPDVAALPEAHKQDAPLTMRQRLAQHRLDPACSTCHERMDEIGMALEGFDAVGRARNVDDNIGRPPGDTPIDGVEGLRDWVLTRGALQRSLSRHMLTFAIGRGFDVRDETAIDTVAAALQPGVPLRELVLAVVESRPFRFRGHDTRRGE